jgi:hypothetical protein
MIPEGQKPDAQTGNIGCRQARGSAVCSNQQTDDVRKVLAVASSGSKQKASVADLADNRLSQHTPAVVEEFNGKAM